MAREIRVLALPAFRNRTLNPYTSLLYTAIDRLGVRVEDAGARTLFGARNAVLHIHWPEYCFSDRDPVLGIAKALLTMLIVTLLRLRSVRIIWTIHNLQGHERWNPRLERHMWRWFVRRIDGYIALTNTGRTAALLRFPELKALQGFVIPHGHYRDAYPVGLTPEEARRQLGIPIDAPVIAFVGAIRPYKNLPALLNAFANVPDPHWRLIIGGAPATPELKREIVRLALRDQRVLLEPAHLPDERLAAFLSAADLLVFPYAEILNSGSVLLALSFERPVLAPRLGALAELQLLAGEDWVRTYDGELTAEQLVAAMARAGATRATPCRLLAALDWEQIARDTVHAYAAVQHARRGSRALVNHSA